MLKGKKHSLKKQQGSGPDPGMAGMLELSSDHVFKTTMINMLMALMRKVNNIQEQIGNTSREMEILKELKC